MLFVASFGLITLAFLGVAALERVPALQFRPAPLMRPHLGSDALWYAVAGGASALSTYAFRPALSQLSMQPLQDVVGHIAGPLRLLAAVAIFDLVAFAVHLTIHQVDALWVFHKVHHSSLHLDWLATTRTHMFEILVRNIPAMATLFLLGFSAQTVSLSIAVYALFAVHGHSNLDMNLRFLERVFVTPRIHRLHHRPATTQKNFGTVFTFWDAAAGKLIRADASPQDKLGVPGERTTYPQNFADAAREPFRETMRRKAEATRAEQAQ